MNPFRIALANIRFPATLEESVALASYAKRYGLAAACRVLFNTNEFVFVD